MAIGIGEVAAVASPENILGRFEDRGSGLFRGCEYPGDLLLGPDIVGDGDSAEAPGGGLRVRGDVRAEFLPAIQAQLGALEVEKGYLLPVLIGRGPTEAIPVKGDGAGGDRRRRGSAG